MQRLKHHTIPPFRLQFVSFSQLVSFLDIFSQNCADKGRTPKFLVNHQFIQIKKFVPKHIWALSRPNRTCGSKITFERLSKHHQDTTQLTRTPHCKIWYQPTVTSINLYVTLFISITHYFRFLSQLNLTFIWSKP